MEPQGKATVCEKLGLGSGVNAGRPVDLTHLARYTLGNQSLEREVLGLFHDRSELLLQRLKAAVGDKAWSDAAHAIKGSASAIGAWHVANSAEAAEALDGAQRKAGSQGILEDLERLIGEAKSYIVFLLAETGPDTGI